MQEITFIHAGKTYTNWKPAEARAAGVPVTTVASAVATAAIAIIETKTDGLRDQLARRCVEYRIKEGLAADMASASPEAVAELTREATARAMTLAELVALINASSIGYQRAVLRLAAVEAECEQRITDIDPAAPDHEAQVAAALVAADADIAQARIDARTLMSGGSA